MFFPALSGHNACLVKLGAGQKPHNCYLDSRIYCLISPLPSHLYALTDWDDQLSFLERFMQMHDFAKKLYEAQWNYFVTFLSWNYFKIRTDDSSKIEVLVYL